MSGIVVGKERKLIHYEVCGRGSPVIFLHGWLGSWRYWMRTMETTGAAGFRAYALDFWGFGDSDRRSVDCYSVGSYADQLVQFVDEIGVVGRVALVGHALGAVVAVEFAKRRPDKVSNLVLVSPPLSSTAAHSKRILSILRDPETAVRRYRLALDEGIPAELRKVDVAAVAAGSRSFIDPATLRSGAIARSALVIHGVEDRFVDAAPARLLSHSADSSRVVLLPCGHFPMLEDHATFNRLLNDLLSGIPATDLQVKAFWRRRQR